MEVDFYLPKPTEDELNLGAKEEYFDRVSQLNLIKKYKITEQDLTFWVHHNYQSVFLMDEELSLTQIKKFK
jgi:hypothetical protein